VNTNGEMLDLARSLTLLLDTARTTLAANAGPNQLILRITDHLGCDMSEVVPVSERFPVWEHVNVQRGVDAYLAEHGRAGEWFGMSSSGHNPNESLHSIIALSDEHGWVKFGAASFDTAAIGPDENTEVVSLGLIATTGPAGGPVLIGIQAIQEFGPPQCRLEILAADSAVATATRNEVDRLMRVHDAFRGQVLTFSQSEHRGNELLSFLPRPAVARRDVVLPQGVLETIEQHVAGIGEWSRELLSSGQHLKRGLLMHGPPGTGKTHTVRYLAGRLSDATVVLLTGTSIRYIDAAAALARRLQPSMVVLEDVDLVGMDRDFSHGNNPLLFSLLDAMDGVGADADVTFVLTTNRADILEVALADRPGRVDLAVEIPRPDAACRERLLRLYARDLAVDDDLAEVVSGTEGVTASYIKELIRRVVLVSLRAGDSPPALRSAYFAEVLAEMNSEHHTLTRSLLGSDTGRAEGGPPPGAVPRPQAPLHFARRVPPPPAPPAPPRPPPPQGRRGSGGEGRRGEGRCGGGERGGRGRGQRAHAYRGRRRAGHVSRAVRRDRGLAGSTLRAGVTALESGQSTIQGGSYGTRSRRVVRRSHAGPYPRNGIRDARLRATRGTSGQGDHRPARCRRREVTRARLLRERGRLPAW
jgi:hypothetical protein